MLDVIFIADVYIYFTPNPRVCLRETLVFKVVSFFFYL